MATRLTVKETVEHSEFTILTRTKNSRSHRETKVTIDWEDVTYEQLKFMAQQLMIHNLQAEIQNGDFDTFPEQVYIRASLQVHTRQPCNKKYEIPASWLSGEDKPKPRLKKVPKKEPTLEEMLAGLSPEELAILLK